MMYARMMNNSEIYEIAQAIHRNEVHKAGEAMHRVRAQRAACLVHRITAGIREMLATKEENPLDLDNAMSARMYL